MDTPNHSATTLRDVSSVLLITQLLSAQNPKTSYQYAPSAQEITQQITGDVKSTKNSNDFIMVKLQNQIFQEQR